MSPHLYPIDVAVDYPDRPLSRKSTFFRIFLLLPIGIVLGMLLSAGGGVQVSFAGFVILPTLLMIVFREKYPAWWFDWNFQLVSFALRVGAYAALLSDEYPSTDDEQYVHVSLPHPDPLSDLNRWLPLVKWFLAIPHYIVLALLSVAGVFAVLVAWFAILFTGRYPRSLFDFLVGLFRWHVRVLGYAGLLVTDEYPPFRLNA